MHLVKSLSVLAVFSWVCAGLPLCAEEAEPISPKDGPIQLFNGKDLSGLYTWLKDEKYEDSRKVFSVENGMLHISGDGMGYICTKQSYKDYHLVIEFRWGDRTWGSRVNKTKDSGVLVHCIGADGGFGGVFMAGLEAQIIEGGVGDFIVCYGKHDDGTPIQSSLTAEITRDRDGEAVWHRGGEKLTIHRGRINWFDRDPDWKDELGFRGKQDVESPGKQWTRMEVVCDGGKITVLVNGVVVNEGFDAYPAAGKILVQTELAEIFVRRLELWPLGKAPSFDKATLQK